jgi:hypothetical protein
MKYGAVCKSTKIIRTGASWAHRLMNERASKKGSKTRKTFQWIAKAPRRRRLSRSESFKKIQLAAANSIVVGRLFLRCDRGPI